MTGKKPIGKAESWSSVILTGEDEKPVNTFFDNNRIFKNFIRSLTGSLFNLLNQNKELFTPYRLNFRNINRIPETDSEIWVDFIEDIPVKLRSLGLYIRTCRNFCRTCLITDEEIEKLAAEDCGKLLDKNKSVSKNYGKQPDKIKKHFLELNYLIPLLLKEAGFEILRKEEISGIDEKVIRKIARAIHSRYQFNLRKQKNQGETAKMIDFDSLPDEIKQSNIDNAWHIPTKLLSIGYTIRKVKKGHETLALRLNRKEVETMASLEHLRWCWDKRLNGWRYGKAKDDRKKLHPGLVPYESLPEQEKEKDRELVRMIPAILKDIEFEACPVNPARIRKLSYAIKPQSSINRILEETRELNEQIRGMVKIPGDVERMVAVRNKKIEEAIREIEGSYKYAWHIQQTFLPDDLFVRECFPESFVLYKPKDIVSGDFYFFSRRNGLVFFAAADCTGHGIPGALLSTIGYGTLDQAVNEAKLTRPHEILHHLYSKIHRFLRHDAEGRGIPDDMDIVFCTLDTAGNHLSWSGVGNPLYRISGKKMIEYPARNIIRDCSEPGDCPFISQDISLKHGDILYLCSDGFIDQFGGKLHKKYQSSRFREFLLRIRNKPMPEQSDLLYREIEQWREENNEDQTDDILVIGIKI